MQPKQNPGAHLAAGEVVNVPGVLAVSDLLRRVVLANPERLLVLAGFSSVLGSAGSLLLSLLLQMLLQQALPEWRQGEP